MANPLSHADDAERRRLEQEIARYRDCVNVHDLPAIYHFWSHRWVLPKLQACGYEGVDHFFSSHIATQCRSGDRAKTHGVISIGAGNCDLEVRLAEQLRADGVTNFRFRCLELNPFMIERGRELAKQAGVEEHFRFDVLDIDDWQPSEPVSVCLANHSLHHIVDLESLFAKIHRAIGQEGVFLTNDMIGRNGHMRWPEALTLVDDIWSEMPQRYKYNHQLSRWEEEYENWDCSVEGNEGIRAQDIMPLLVETFAFESCVAFGNLVDIFVDRSFGHNFDPEKAEDLAFIERIAELDEAKIDGGELKPTHLLAAMRARPVAATRIYRDWTPDFCVRWPNRAPEARQEVMPAEVPPPATASAPADEEESILARDWFYEFTLPSGRRTRSYAPAKVREIHCSRETMLFAELERRLETSAWPTLRCLDLACHQGYFATALAQRGAQHVLGVDGRRRHVEDARQMSRALGLDNASFLTADLQQIRPEALGRYDLTLLFGVLYHLEDLISVLRLARAVSRDLCVIETQIGPELSGSLEWGSVDQRQPIVGALSLVDERRDSERPEHGESSLRGLSVVPSLSGLSWLLSAVGFSEVEVLEPPPDAYEQLARGQRVMVVAS
ncbi:MAG: class I SAM-dependent methyltransferase [Acidobacteriota bacterium]